jgi:hypothetical protein
LSLLAICSGLHATAHRRSCRRPCRRPIQRTSGPGTVVPSGLTIRPPRRSCTYCFNRAFAASFATFGRRARRSACHCAVVARYSKVPPRVAALRRNSREIVDGDRCSWRAISRTPWPRTRGRATSSRSANERKRPDRAPRRNDGIPPLWRNHRVPTAGDTPAVRAASSLDNPRATPAQNRCRHSQPPAGGRPGDRIGARSARSDRRCRVAIVTRRSQDVATTD